MKCVQSQKSLKHNSAEVVMSDVLGKQNDLEIPTKKQITHHTFISYYDRFQISEVHTGMLGHCLGWEGFIKTSIPGKQVSIYKREQLL